MNSLNKVDLIDLYYPTHETIAAFLTVPPGQREAVLRRRPWRVRGRDGSAHFSSLGNDRYIRQQRSVMEIGYLSAFVLSQFHRWSPWILTLRRSRAAAKIFYGQSLVRFTTNTHKVQLHAPLHRLR